MVRANTLTWEDIQRERGPRLSILTFLLISLLPPDSPHYYPMKWSHVRYNLQDNMKHTYFFIVESECVFLMPFPLLSPLILIATMKGKTYSLSWAKIWMSIWVDITDSIYFSQFWSLEAWNHQGVSMVRIRWGSLSQHCLLTTSPCGGEIMSLKSFL